jgi:hypothetical protein
MAAITLSSSVKTDFCIRKATEIMSEYLRNQFKINLNQILTYETVVHNLNQEWKPSVRGPHVTRNRVLQIELDPCSGITATGAMRKSK